MKQNEIFLNRTDALASKLRMTLRETCAFVGLSFGSFFGYRTGRVEISVKAWRKLEEAEIKAGINQVTRDEITSPAEKLVTRDELPDNQLHVELIAQLAALTAAITEQNKRIDTLLEQTAATTREAQATSSRSSGVQRTSTSQKAGKKLA